MPDTDLAEMITAVRSAAMADTPDLAAAIAAVRWAIGLADRKLLQIGVDGPPIQARMKDLAAAQRVLEAMADRDRLAQAIHHCETEGFEEYEESWDSVGESIREGYRLHADSLLAALLERAGGGE